MKTSINIWLKCCRTKLHLFVRRKRRGASSSSNINGIVINTEKSSKYEFKNLCNAYCAQMHLVMCHVSFIQWLMQLYERHQTPIVQFTPKPFELENIPAQSTILSFACPYTSGSQILEIRLCLLLLILLLMIILIGK